jgi:hypothetical protein
VGYLRACLSPVLPQADGPVGAARNNAEPLMDVVKGLAPNLRVHVHLGRASQ